MVHSIYHIVLNSRPGIYFLPEVLDPAWIRDRQLRPALDEENLLRRANHNIIRVTLVAGEQSYFSNECCKRLPCVQAHMDARNQRSAFSTERTTQSPWQFRYFRGEERALCQRPLTALNTPPVIIREPAFIIVQDLWPPALKRDPASKQHGGYSRQYGTHIASLRVLNSQLPLVPITVLQGSPQDFRVEWRLLIIMIFNDIHNFINIDWTAFWVREMF